MMLLPTCRGGEEGSDGAAAWDFNQKLHQYKLKE